MRRNAKIIATIGPASATAEKLSALIKAGMNVARLNFSHGSYDDHRAVIKRLRGLHADDGQPVGILQDLSGPKLRTGVLANHKPVRLAPGEPFTLTTRSVEGDEHAVSVDYALLPKDVKPGDRILLDDGNLELVVNSCTDDAVETSVVVGGLLGEHKGLNLPGVSLSAPSMTLKDIEDLQFGLEHHVDAVALSFVRKPEDIQELRERISAQLGDDTPHPLIIAKLERPEAIDNLAPILDLCDGVMVARGDLGVEMRPERVPSIQKQIIREASRKQRFAITATQMLESMIENPRPTRAEASDVANAVFDGSDALMLSGETAVGGYPVEAVETMDRIILDAEAHAKDWGQYRMPGASTTQDDAIATTHAARALAHDRDVAAIAVFTRSGRTAWLMANVRPGVAILAFTPERSTYQQLSLAWGVTPFLIRKANSVEEMIEVVHEACLHSNLVAPGEQVVMVASLPVGAMGPPNFTLLQTIR